MSVVARHPPRTAAGRWIAGDLTQAGFVQSTLKAIRPQTIVNCAGTTTGAEALMRDANVSIVRNVLDGVRLLDDPVRLVQIGSAAEYGPSTLGEATSESDPAHPSGPYGRTKAEATRLVLRPERAERALVLRLFNVVGAGAPEDSLIGSAIRAITTAQSEGADQIQLGRLDAYRDFLHVADAADAVVAATTSSPAVGHIVNVGSGVATLARDLVRELVAIAGFAGEIIEIDAGGARSAEIAWQQANISVASELLGWRPRRSLSDALRDAWDSRLPRAGP